MVVYVTSVQAVRSTYDECRQVVQMLRNMHVAFQQKDVFLHPDYRKELTERLGIDKPTVPQVSISMTGLFDLPISLGFILKVTQQK